MPPLHLGEGGRDNTLLLNHCDPAMTDTTYTQISPGEFAPNPSQMWWGGGVGEGGRKCGRWLAPQQVYTLGEAKMEVV